MSLSCLYDYSCVGQFYLSLTFILQGNINV
uniref:Uncharacterized protein n=1 Tax=Arundo donax TaxID=35708 RepID=A0A0A9A6N2_ARUDO